MTIQDGILKRLTDFQTLCKDHKVKYLYAFGSSVSDRFDPRRSDIDLLVELQFKN
jgi:predicted nucleotidyltransferase